MSSRPRRPSAIAEPSLVEAGYGPDRALMLHHFPRGVRPGIAALWAIDEAMAAVVAEASQPVLGAIKLAWWAEALARLDSVPSPPEPRLQAVVAELLPRGISGAEVAGIERGWRALLDESPDSDEVAVRGQVLFAISARLLGTDDAELAEAGRLFALGDAMRRGFPEFADARDRSVVTFKRRRIGRPVRPITLAARLAARDPREPEATPGRAVALIAHRLTGTI